MKHVIFDDQTFEEQSVGMEFRLTYAGPLYATQRDARQGQKPKHSENKAKIRRQIHLQLKQLWHESAALNGAHKADNSVMMTQSPVLTKASDLATRHAQYGFSFVPLVTEELELICSIDILFLRPDKPGGAVWAGDIDNRLKTLLDALRIPEAGEDYSAQEPEVDEKPFFVLLEDDKLISRVSVETDRLLEPIGDEYEPHDARLVITVKIRPYELTISNMHFG